MMQYMILHDTTFHDMNFSLSLQSCSYLSEQPSSDQDRLSIADMEIEITMFTMEVNIA